MKRRVTADAVLVYHARQLSSVLLMFNHATGARRPFVNQNSVHRVSSSMVRINPDVKNTMRPTPYLHSIPILSSQWRPVSQHISIRRSNLTLFEYLSISNFYDLSKFAQSSAVNIPA